MSHFNEFQLLALQLINLVERRRDEMLQSTAQRHMSPQTFAREYATLHLNAGRCVGKSELIRQIMRADDIVIVPNESLRDVLFATKASQTLAASQLDTWWRPTPKRVFIDEPGAVDAQIGLSAIYIKFARAMATPTFILLGE